MSPRHGTDSSRLNIQVAAGAGSGCTSLAAFDSALQTVGAANFNLIRLSSVIPAMSVLSLASTPRAPPAAARRSSPRSIPTRRRAASTSGALRERHDRADAGLEARLRAGCRCRSGRVTRRTAASYGWWRTSYMPIGWRPSRPAADAPQRGGASAAGLEGPQPIGIYDVRHHRKRQRFDASRAQTGSDIRRGAARPVQRRLGHDALEAPQMLMPLSVA